ncbi:MAG: hypothetical protein ACXAC7_00185 [Candidatus Hodarchaeales archaeon]|jgi:tetratricopeptide (TPR) repeat protein
MQWYSPHLLNIIFTFTVIIAITLRQWYKIKRNNDNTQTQFYQGGGIEGIIVLIIIIGIIGLILQQTNKNKQLDNANHLLESNQFNRAMEVYLKHKKYEDAAKTIVKSPAGTQILLLRQLQANLSKARLKSLFLQLGDKFQTQGEIQLAASAFSLAELPWKAAQTYILAGETSKALEVLSNSAALSRDRERAVRNLAKFAYENNKVLESADLLQSIGAEDEAVAVLVAAGRSSEVLSAEAQGILSQEVHRSPPIPITEDNQQKISNTSTVKSSSRSSSSSHSSISSRSKKPYSGPSPYVLLRQQLNRTRICIRDGQIKDAEAILDRAGGLVNRIPLSDSEEAKKLKLEFKRLQEAIRLLQTARTAFKQKRIEDAQVSYSELLDLAGEFFSAEVYAEAGLTYEYEPIDKETAHDYFLEASNRASTKQASERYKERSEVLIQSITDLPSTPTTGFEVSSELKEFNHLDPCIVCKRPVGKDQVVQCHHCQSVAHYAHMAEWLKIKGKCPVCKQKLSISKIRIATKA